ncbi:hypothetical protein AGLY_011772 [Aphis glycines]|uniref:Uncharacterized protein n=1 Tax=Aphis glycines TaxID=307491 RepID=A0A6G0TB56_APHGL|nr:hypothetical protein AGLY_011772 [Aphis glycines]
MIRTLINLLFNIQFNDVQNLDIFIDHFDSQKTCESTTLICEFRKIFSYCTLNWWYDFTNVPCKLLYVYQSVSYSSHNIIVILIAVAVRLSYDYASSILPCRQSTRGGLRTPRDVYLYQFFFLIGWIKYNNVPSRGFHIVINSNHRALKVLGFIKRNTSLFTSPTCLRFLYFSLVRSILEYGIVVWHPYLAKDQLRLERVQNRFLSYAAFLLKIAHSPHDYSSIRSSLNIPLLSSRRIESDLSFATSLLNGTVDAPDLLSSIPFRVPVHYTRNHFLYLVPSHRFNYSQNHPLHRMLRLLNNL